MSRRTWGYDRNDLRDHWLDALPGVPAMPPGTTTPDIPIHRIDRDVLVLGTVGLGSAVWGPFRVYQDQIVAGVDAVPTDAPAWDAAAVDLLLGSPQSICRITWTEMVEIEGQYLPGLMLEPMKMTPSDGQP